MLFLASGLCLFCSHCQSCSLPTPFLHLANSFFRIQNSHHLPLGSLLRLHLPSQAELCASSLFAPNSHAAVNLNLAIYQPVHSTHYNVSSWVHSPCLIHPCVWLLAQSVCWSELNYKVFFTCITYHWMFTTVFEICKYYYSHFTK